MLNGIYHVAFSSGIGSASGTHGFFAQGQVVGQPKLKITIKGKLLGAAV